MKNFLREIASYIACILTAVGILVAMWVVIILVGLLSAAGSKAFAFTLPVIVMDYKTVSIQQPDGLLEGCLFNNTAVIVAPCVQVAAEQSQAMKEINPESEVRVIVDGMNWSEV